SARGEVEDASARVGAAVVDFDDDRAAVVEVCHLRERGQWERSMRGSGGDRVEDLAACSPVAHQVVPGSFPELTMPNRTNEAGTAVQDAAARIYFGLETARFIGRRFRVFLAEVGGLIR